MFVYLRELECPLCGGKDLEKLGENEYRCKFCGLDFQIVDVDEEGNLEVDISTATVNYYDVEYERAEAIIKCPHCGRDIYLWLGALGDLVEIVAIKGDQEVLDKIRSSLEDEEPEGEED